MTNHDHVSRRGFMAGAAALATSAALTVSAPNAVAASGKSTRYGGGQAPRLSVAGRSTFHVDDYGADPAGVSDSTAAIRLAIQDAQAHTAANGSHTAVVAYGSGVYKLSSSIEMDGLERTTFVGGGNEGSTSTTLLMHSKLGTYFRFSNCSDIKVRGLILDRPDEHLPWTQFTIVDTSGYSPSSATGYLDVRIDDGYPSLGDPFFDIAGSRYGFPQLATGLFSHRFFALGPLADPANPGSWRQALDEPNRLWRIRFNNFSNNAFFVGQRVAFINTQDDGTALRILNGKRIKFVDVTNRASSGMGVLAYKLEDFTLERYKAIPGPGRLLSSARDALHLTGGSWGAMRITDSTFQGSGDDILNFAFLCDPVTRISDSQVRINLKGRGPLAYVGDQIELYNPSTRTLRGVSTVTAVDGETLTIDPPISYAAGDTLFNNQGTFAEVVIKNNQFFNHRGRGLLPHGRNVRVVENLFQNLDQAMLVNTTPTAVREGPVNAGLTVRGNTFTNIFEPRGSIEIGGEPVATASAPSAVGFDIVNNVFDGVMAPALRVDLAKEVKFSKNDVSFSGTTARPAVQLGLVARKIDLAQVKRTTISDLSGSAMSTVVQVETGTTGVSISNVCGDYSVPQFINNSGNPLVYEGVSTTASTGPAGGPCS